MELSILIAKIISIIYLAGGVSVLLGNVNFEDMAQDFAKSSALSFVAGSFGIIIGMILVLNHNHWVKNWSVLITIVSWSMLLGGLTVVIFPKSLTFMSKYYTSIKLLGIYMICLGLLFGYFGFIQ